MSVAGLVTGVGARLVNPSRPMHRAFRTHARAIGARLSGIVTIGTALGLGI